MSSIACKDVYDNRCSIVFLLLVDLRPFSWRRQTALKSVVGCTWHSKFRKAARPKTSCGPFAYSFYPTKTLRMSLRGLMAGKIDLLQLQTHTVAQNSAFLQSQTVEQIIDAKWLSTYALTLQFSSSISYINFIKIDTEICQSEERRWY